MNDTWYSGDLAEAIISALPDAHILTDSEFTVRMVNEAASALLGFSSDAIVDRHLPTVLAPDRTAEYELLAQKLKASIRIDPFTTVVGKADGTPLHVRMIPQPVENSSEGGAALLFRIEDISGAFVSENRQREMREDFELFFDFNPNYCYMVSAGGDIVDVNRSALRILGYEKEELVGNPVHIIYAPETRAEIEELMRRWRSTGRIENREITIQTKTGERRTVILNVTSFRKMTGEIDHSLLIQQDITKMKQVEEDLHRSETRLRRTQAIAHLGAWEYDASVNSLAWSDETFRIFGRDPDSFVPTYDAFLEAVHPEDREKVRRRFEDSITLKQNGYEVKHRIFHGITGKVRWVYERCFHQWSKVGELLGSFGMVQDITDQELLTREYERYYQAMQFSTNAVVLTDMDGTITHVNPRFEQLYGYTKEEAIGENPRILNPGRDVYFDYGYSEAEYNELFMTLWRDIRNPEIGSWDGDLLNRTKFGELVRVHLYLNTVRDSTGEIVSFVGMPIDVSSQHEREREVRVQTYMAIADLAEQRDNETGQHMKRIGEFSSFIARELTMSTKFCDDIRIFAPLHDIGKVGIADAILLAERKLTPEEFEIMKTHTTIGYDILKSRPTMEMAADIAYGHQEWYDGSGYPRGLRGDQIPLPARITALADVYDALRSERPYKRPFSEEETVRIITEKEPGHFDPELISVLYENREEFDRIFSAWSDV